MNDIVGQAAGSNLLLGLAALGLTSSGTVAAGVAAKSAISAAASAVTGTTTLVNQEVYQKQIASLIVKAIQKSRADKLREIREHRHESVDDYTVDDVITDVQEYHRLCAFSEGLVALSKAIDQPAPTPTPSPSGPTAGSTGSPRPTTTKSLSHK